MLPFTAPFWRASGLGLRAICKIFRRFARGEPRRPQRKFFFGPIGCAIGAALGAVLGGAAGAAAGGAATYFGIIKPILQDIFDAGPRNVESANVGDKALGPIQMGDKVAVMGEHVYDGYHDGWNEFHPLMAVVKIDKSGGVGPGYYLEWQPSLPQKPPPPPTGRSDHAHERGHEAGSEQR